MDDEQRYQAAVSKDARFDGVFFTAVRTTGIYCRPSCPAITPKRANVTFYPTAAAAQQAGYRSCKRCRPDASPGSPDWNVRSDVAGRAMRLIADGIVDRDGVPGLAARLGYSPRQIGRVLAAEVGAGPLALARAHHFRREIGEDRHGARMVSEDGPGRGASPRSQVQERERLLRPEGQQQRHQPPLRRALRFLPLRLRRPVPDDLRGLPDDRVHVRPRLLHAKKATEPPGRVWVATS